MSQCVVPCVVSVWPKPNINVSSKQQGHKHQLYAIVSRSVQRGVHGKVVCISHTHTRCDTRETTKIQRLSLIQKKSQDCIFGYSRWCWCWPKEHHNVNAKKSKQWRLARFSRWESLPWGVSVIWRPVALSRWEREKVFFHAWPLDHCLTPAGQWSVGGRWVSNYEMLIKWRALAQIWW